MKTGLASNLIGSTTLPHHFDRHGSGVRTGEVATLLHVPNDQHHKESRLDLSGKGIRCQGLLNQAYSKLDLFILVMVLRAPHVISSGGQLSRYCASWLLDPENLQSRVLL